MARARAAEQDGTNFTSELPNETEESSKDLNAIQKKSQPHQGSQDTVLNWSGVLEAQQIKKPNRWAARKPKQRHETDIARDQAVEQVFKQASSEINPSMAHFSRYSAPNGPINQEEALEWLNATRRNFFEQQAERQENRKKKEADKDKPKGPKLGGGRSAMVMAQKAAVEQKQKELEREQEKEHLRRMR